LFEAHYCWLCCIDEDVFCVKLNFAGYAALIKVCFVLSLIADYAAVMVCCLL
jgi:hypothetical protein